MKNPLHLTLGLLALSAALIFSPAQAQFRPPAFAGGVPGMAQMRAVVMQAHQRRTLLYREAIEELRKNPAAADVRECAQGKPAHANDLCIPQPDAAAPAVPSAAPSSVPSAVAPSPAPATAAGESPAVTQAAPQTAPQVAAPKSEADPRRIALLIGINSYLKPIPSLETPLGDVEEIGKVLQSRYGYDVRVVRDAGKAEIVKALNQLAADSREQDSVLIMYAGHGYLMDDTNMGYWIPADASVKTAANWISNTDIAKFLRAIPSGQLILVSDSCFSGSLTREQRVSGRTAAPRDKSKPARSVLAFSSGGEEPVSDEGKEGHSIFAYHFIKELSSSSGTTPGFDVYRVVKERVSKEYPQEPQYGAITSAGHLEGGEYFFQPR